MVQEERANPPLQFRLAKYSDAKALADLHYICMGLMEEPKENALMYQLGRKFLTTYYRIILQNKSSIVICADAKETGIVGLVSATIEASEELKALRSGCFRLLLSALPALIRQPRLIISAYVRTKVLSRSEIGKEFINRFIIGTGARISFWGWSPDYYAKGQALKLLQAALKLLKTLGIETVRLETDRTNRNVIVLHRLMGAKVIEEFETRDGRKRIFMEHRL